MYLIDQARDHWNQLRGHNDLPAKEELDPINIPKLLGNSCLIDVLDGGIDFRYRIIGSAIQDISRAGQSGKKISEIDTQRSPSKIYDLFHAAVEGYCPQYTTLDYIGEDARVGDIHIGVFPLAAKEMPKEVKFLWSVVEVDMKLSEK
ncbi:PAS domain-containing protein [Kiloniella majae]|uniref:PAS domain-containing protein n=1 Tax=Kiloniella majae TaxID=1938558 RepID=UPI000A278198|nr:PAS domain-containing protein [Kiloniella majae]